MRKYFIVAGYQRKGPYSIDELRERKITKDTLIWFFELSEPKPAGEIEQIKDAFSEAKTPIVDAKEPEKEEVKPEAKGVRKEEKKATNLQSDEEFERLKQEKIKEYQQQKAEELKRKREEEAKRKKEAEEKKRKVEELKSKAEKEKKRREEELKRQKQEELKRQKAKELERQKQAEEQQLKELQEQAETRHHKNKGQIELTKIQKEQENFEKQKTAKKKAVTVQPKRTKPTDKSINEKPRNYLIESIIATIMCCNPLGVVSLLMAIKSDKAFKEGDIELAKKSAKSAKTLFYITVLTGILFYVFMVILGSE